MNNLAVIIALVTAVAAILAPSITAFINNRHQLKLKKIEMFFNDKLSAYRDFVKTFGIFQDNYKGAEWANFLAAAYYVMMICSKSSAEKIFEFIKQKPFDAQGDFDKFNDCLISLSKELAADRSNLVVNNIDSLIIPEKP